MLNQLGKQILEINKANGWDVATFDDWGNPEKVATKLALIHSEVSEALEAIRNKDEDNFAEELADIVIRVLDLSAGLEIDMDDEVQIKLEENKKRGYRHGGKVI